VGAPWDGWTQTEDGRPIPQSGWYWSVSHKGDWVAAVIARHPIGIDIEFIRPRSPRAWKALARPEEWDMIMTPRLSKISSVDSFLDGSPTYGSVDETLSASDFVQWLPFFRMWTAKEAVLKASGVGLERLDDCRLSDVGPSGGMTLNFESQSIGVEHDILGRSVAAVTTGPIPVKWQRNH
jgi:4'-phosphopantetheinyl transferase